jgi:signal transduction histidine kinase
MTRRMQWWRGLEARLALIFTVGALLVSAMVAGATYGLARNQLLLEAENQHLEQVFYNAREVRTRLLSLPEDADEESVNTFYRSTLIDLNNPNGSQAAVLPANGDFRSQTLKERELPTQLRTLLIDPVDPGVTAVQMRYRQDDEAKYAVAVVLEEVDAVYYEVLPLGDLEATLGSLRAILVGVSLAASAAGAGLGFYAARRAVSPVSRISAAAKAIAAGDFSTRLDLQADRDLAVLSEAFNEMVDTVSQRIEREQRFTSDVSHELRSPLMTLTASVEVLERRKESLPDVAQQAIDLLSQDLWRFQRLVEDLLEISRAEAGAVQLERSNILLAEFLENVLAQTRNAFVPLEHEPADAETVVAVDKRRLAQVMINLIENAEKYGGGVDRVSFEVLDDQVQIVVDDSGPGVPIDLRERIFERFGRIDSSAGNRASVTGFGLGLSLVAEHVRLHGGKVWVTDRIDGEHGARFVVQLPLAELGDDGHEHQLKPNSADGWEKGLEGAPA